MREIKFRAWNKEQKVMVYDNEDGSCGWWDGARCSNLAMLNSILNNSEYEMMQYTGLKDMNGREIYEGDICSLIHYQMRCIRCVEFNEKKSRFELRNKGWTALFHESYEIEVIGNVHDNPELLGGM